MKALFPTLTERLLVLIDVLDRQMHAERCVTRYQELLRERAALVAEVEARKKAVAG